MQPLEKPVSNLQGSLFFCIGHENNELITRIADSEPFISRHLLDQAGHPDEYLVSGLMAVSVVDLLEVVQVHHKQ